MKTSEALNATADYLREYGWGANWFPVYGQPACLEGAGKMVCQAETKVGHAFWYETVKPYLTEYIRTRFGLEDEHPAEALPWVWNDRQSSVEPVIELLRAAAVIEEARENAEVRETISV